MERTQHAEKHLPVGTAQVIGYRDPSFCEDGAQRSAHPELVEPFAEGFAQLDNLNQST